MNLKIRLSLASAVGVFLAGCGKSSPPCTGSSCLNVAGTYTATITQNAGTTCKYIIYGTSSIQTPMIITQDGSALTVNFPNFLGVTVPGTLWTDDSADFSAQTTANVDSQDGSEALAYSDTSSVTLSFVQGGSGITASGTKEDVLVATPPNPSGEPDNDCVLEGTIQATPSS